MELAGTPELFALVDRAAAEIRVCGGTLTGAAGLLLANCDLPSRLQKLALTGPIAISRDRNDSHSFKPGVHRHVNLTRSWQHLSGIPIASPGDCLAQLATELLPCTYTPPWAKRKPWRSLGERGKTRRLRGLLGVGTAPMALTDFTAGLNSVFLDLVVVTDALTRRTARLVKSLEVLIADINALGARPGVRVARLALKHCAPDTDSCPETWVRLAMLDAGLPAGIPNVVVASSSGGPKRFIDVGLEGYKIGVEYHGVYHFESNEQAYEDMRRREQLRALGWTIIEACRDDLPNQFRLIQRIAAETARAEGVRLPGGAPA